VTVLLHSSVVDLATDEDPAPVVRVEVRREERSSCFVRTRLVLAGGGIENSRLLQRRVHRRRLGDNPDLVERFFAERLSARSGYVVPASPKLAGRRDEFSAVQQVPEALC
jgi:hypothetical protein